MSRAQQLWREDSREENRRQNYSRRRNDLKSSNHLINSLYLTLCLPGEYRGPKDFLRSTET